MNHRRRIPAAVIAAAALLAVAALFSSAAPAAAGGQARMRDRPRLAVPHVQWRSLMTRLDDALALGDTASSADLIARLQRLDAPSKQLITRRIRLAGMSGDQALVASLCREGLAESPRNAGLMRELARALLEMERLDAAEAVLDSMIEFSPSRRSTAASVVSLLRGAGHPDRALKLCEAEMARDPGGSRLGRQRAYCLIELGRIDGGMTAIAAALAERPLNLALIRQDLSAMLAGDTVRLRAAEALDASGAAADSAAVRLLRADFRLWLGEADAAAAAVLPLLEDRARARELLGHAALVGREAPLLESPAERAAATAWLLEVLGRLASDSVLPQVLVRRALDLQAAAAEDALFAGLLPEQPAAAAERLAEILERIEAEDPASERLFTSRIALARFERDELQRPLSAASRLERLLSRVELPLEGEATARLLLGECRLAAGDTARGRRVLADLAADPRHRPTAGYAHFHLARLDLAQGHYAHARDRLASIALDSPAADYANDALDLGLAVAEELGNPVGGPRLLEHYARAVGWELAARPDRRAEALSGLVADAASAGDPEGPQHLVERARFELAELRLAAGDTAAAIEQCDRILLDHPDGRYPAAALDLKGRMLAAAGRAGEAREAWERLLLQYPEHLFADDVRDRVRSLP